MFYNRTWNIRRRDRHRTLDANDAQVSLSSYISSHSSGNPIYLVQFWKCVSEFLQVNKIDVVYSKSRIINITNKQQLVIISKTNTFQSTISDWRSTLSRWSSIIRSRIIAVWRSIIVGWFKKKRGGKMMFVLTVWIFFYQELLCLLWLC